MATTLATVGLRDMNPGNFTTFDGLRPEVRARTWDNRLKHNRVEMQETLVDDQADPTPQALAAMAFHDEETLSALAQARSMLGSGETWHQHNSYVANIALKSILFPSAPSGMLAAFGVKCFSQVELDGTRVSSATLNHDLAGSDLLSFLVAFFDIYERTSGFKAGAEMLLRAFAEQWAPGVQQESKEMHVYLFKERFSSCFVRADSPSLTGKGAKWQVKELCDENNRPSRRGKDSPERRSPPPQIGGQAPPTAPVAERACRQKAQAKMLPAPPAVGALATGVGQAVTSVNYTFGQAPPREARSSGAGAGAAGAPTGAGGGGGAAAAARTYSAEEELRSLEAELEAKNEDAKRRALEDAKRQFQSKQKELLAQFQTKKSSMLDRHSSPLKADIQKEGLAIESARKEQQEAEKQVVALQEKIKNSSEKKRKAEEQLEKEKKDEKELLAKLEVTRSKIASKEKEVKDEETKIKSDEESKEALEKKPAECNLKISESNKRKLAAEKKLESLQQKFGATPEKRREPGGEAEQGGGASKKQRLEGKFSAGGGG